MRSTALVALLALLALLLVACAPLSGTPLDSCGRDWFDAESVIAVPANDREEAAAVPIGCARRIGEERIRLGFEMPPGPTCHRLARVELEETADAVAVTLLLAESNDPAAGACAPRPSKVVTEVDVQAPIAEREILDASRDP